ncbi:PEP-CTERM sorting domain-containing protein [Thalassotalea piscium]|uniref:Ice-binding protein C-terminal domain-containing protein n=1 Tax=Thalassotalea piscium TaxID=1230533 RepID=A0A7X0TTL1_9GAMM|nr:PEP-CTERM sorting domain-containing protein [Thalassotalea piscium]MBB6543239.1 hypothetical protein [Thalassotalea piscium]
MKFITIIMFYLSIQFSANAGLIFSLDESNVNTGDTVTVNLSAEQIPSFDEMSLFIEFDTSAFSYVLGSFTSVIDDTCSDCFIDATPEFYGLNLFFLDFAGEFDTNGLGLFTLASFQLTANNAGDTTLGVQENAFENYFFNSVTFDEYIVNKTELTISVADSPVSQVPEPSTIILMLVAVGLLVSRKTI